MWFEELMGFKEKDPKQVRDNLFVEDGVIQSTVNGKRYAFGNLDISTLKILQEETSLIKVYQKKMKISQVVGDVRDFHKDRSNEGAVFQAASQFNLLEMANPFITPESGVAIYEEDYTQGPMCAIACGAGTIYRNYFARVKNKIGQTSDCQIDCLDEIGLAFNNSKFSHWKMQNGYALANSKGLKYIAGLLDSMEPNEYEVIKRKLKIGIQWNTEVTIIPKGHTVTQVYCSALPIAYSKIIPDEWKKFAVLILEATYEATFYAALKNYNKTGNGKLYLTLVGGGVFGNKIIWILNAIKKAVQKFRHTPLDVKIISFRPSTEIKQFMDSHLTL